ncbi:MAG: helix-turn-helix domain-containing protein [Rhodocyclales bacterium]|nr:helix-turn-helix domain-containing protein [Rhodocyclales bacterium]
MESTSQAETPPVSTSLGNQLRQARKALGCSVADVVQVIRFSAHQIEAIERDDYASLPGATSARGLVRNYAKFLKLDPQPLLALLEPAVPVPEADVRPPSNMGVAEQVSLRERIPVHLLGMVATLAILAFTGFWYFGTEPETTVVSRPATLASSQPPMPAADAAASTPLSVAPPVAPTVAGSAGGEAPSAPPPAAGLRIEFDDRSWIEIRDATQKVVLVGEYAAGTRHSVDGKAPFQLWIGRASGVRVYMGERAIDLKPHTREEVARFTLD